VNGGKPVAIIAEDEPVLRTQLHQMLGAVWPDLIIATAAEDGFQAMQALRSHAPDVLFLDIQMPGITGLEIARQASTRHHVVFITAYDEYAVAAFEEGAVDSLMQPLDASRLVIACDRVKARMSAAPSNLDGLLDALTRRAAGAKPYLRWINASLANDLKLITVEEVCFFQSDSKYTRVVTSDSESLIRKPLKELLNELDPGQFWQIHRSTIVNASFIASVARELSGGLIVKLKNRGDRLAVSHQFAHRFRQM
jgi:DNA-binding LytR/AlgR family response regulator